MMILGLGKPKIIKLNVSFKHGNLLDQSFVL